MGRESLSCNGRGGPSPIRNDFASDLPPSTLWALDARVQDVADRLHVKAHDTPKGPMIATPDAPHAHAVHNHLVHDAVGPPLSGVHAAATIAVGINSLMVIGVMPILLGALADEHRLSAAGIGQAATLELLAMGVSTALAGMFLEPARLKL